MEDPTNYLDISAVMWLQRYLDTFSSTILVVAHDRDFLDSISQQTVTRRKQTLACFDGNPSERERHELSKRKGQLNTQAALDKKKEAIEKTFGRNEECKEDWRR